MKEIPCHIQIIISLELSLLIVFVYIYKKYEWIDEHTTTAYCELFVGYFTGTAVSMSLHKPTITLTLNLCYEFSNSFHAKQTSTSSNCWL